MNNTLKKIQLLIRSEMAVAQFRIRAVVGQVAFIGAALVFLLLSIAALDISFFHYLAETKSPALSALIVGISNLLLAGLLVYIAVGFGSNNEHEAAARQIRDASYNNLTSDLESARNQVMGMSDNVKQIGKNVSKISNTSMSVIAPAAALLLRRRSEQSDNKRSGSTRRTARTARKSKAASKGSKADEGKES